jgi:hypothetical protein
VRARGMVAGVGLALLIQATAAAAGPCESTACRSHFTVRDRVSQWRSAQLFEGFKGTVRLYAAGRRLPARPMADGCGTTFAGQHVRARLRFCGNRVPLRIAYRGAPGVRVTVVYRALQPAVSPPPPPPPPPA